MGGEEEGGWEVGLEASRAREGCGGCGFGGCCGCVGAEGAGAGAGGAGAGVSVWVAGEVVAVDLVLLYVCYVLVCERVIEVLMCSAGVGRQG